MDDSSSPGGDFEGVAVVGGGARTLSKHRRTLEQGTEPFKRSHKTPGNSFWGVHVLAHMQLE